LRWKEHISNSNIKKRKMNRRASCVFTDVSIYSQIYLILKNLDG